MKKLVDVYPYREKEAMVEFLILKRRDNVKYPQQWRMVGGKVRKEETFYESALRELQEETGIDPVLFWTIPSVNQFYDHETDSIYRIPAFAAKTEHNTSIELNHEHSDFKWIPSKEIRNFIFWPEQRRLMELLSEIVMHNQLLAEWIIKTRK